MLNPSRCARTLAVVSTGLLPGAPAQLTGDNNSGPSASRQVDGYYYALDARTGVQLWRTSLAASVHGSPISYVAGGTQCVAVSAGNSLFAFALRRP